MISVQLNVRIDSELKAAGDAVLERFGVPAVQIVRDVWQYMADHQRLPELTTPKPPRGMANGQGAAQLGVGMAMRLAREAGLRAELDAMSFEELRESAYEEMLVEEAERRA